MVTHYSRIHPLNAAVPINKVSQHMQNTKAQHHQRKRQIINSTARAIRARFHAEATTPKTARARAYFSRSVYRRKTQGFVQILTFKSHRWFVKTKLSCEASVEFQELKLWKQSFRAMLRSNSRVVGMERKLSCEASVNFQELKVWKWSFLSTLLSDSNNARCNDMPSTQQFQCTKCLNTCKTQNTIVSIIKEKKKSPGTISSTARAIRA